MIEHRGVITSITDNKVSVKILQQSACSSCHAKGACTAATVEAACKTDNTGADCWGDTDKCRLKECKDFSGTTHAACKKIRSNCTVGLNGKCALMANCEATTVRAACI